VIGITVRSESSRERKACFAAGDKVENTRASDRSYDLSDNVGWKLRGRESLANHQADRDGWVEVTSGDVSDGKGHSKNCETEGEGNSDKANA
jgi:hypothetical protein